MTAARSITAALLLGTTASLGAQSLVRAPRRALAPAYHVQQLTSRYYSEGAAVGDFDRDGQPDIVSGPYWWKGPLFTQRQKIYKARSFALGAYADNFASYVADFNRDGYDDLLVVGFPGRAIDWYENPKTGNTLWKKHSVWPYGGMETALLADLDGDQRPELICSTLGYLIFLKSVPQKPSQAWTFTLVSPLRAFGTSTHGLGVGDINGDGRVDILTAKGWFEQGRKASGGWRAHAAQFGAGTGGARIYSHDIDGDGDADVVTSINAHGYGLSWFEQYRRAGRILFREHVIQKPTRNKSNPQQFSQLHALGIADMDGDGLLDIVTGKTFWAHLGLDPGAKDPAVVYWFRQSRKAGLQFEPRLIHSDSGLGRQFVIEDLNGDGRPDIVSGNKKGVFAFIRTR